MGALNSLKTDALVYALFKLDFKPDNLCQRTSDHLSRSQQFGSKYSFGGGTGRITLFGSLNVYQSCCQLSKTNGHFIELEQRLKVEEHWHFER
tara:strand:- start:1180 stop:1458 length:279 start_codon:yes stop_codon:yes gene_type:complete